MFIKKKERTVKDGMIKGGGIIIIVHEPRRKRGRVVN